MEDFTRGLSRLEGFCNGAQKVHVEAHRRVHDASKPAHEGSLDSTKDPWLKCRLFHKLYECKNGTKNRIIMQIQGI